MDATRLKILVCSLPIATGAALALILPPSGVLSAAAKGVELKACSDIGTRFAPKEMLTNFVRLSNQPILAPRPGKFDEAGAFNPAAALLDNGRTILLYRGQDNKGVSRVGYAQSDDGVHFTAADTAVLSPGQAEDQDGVEDPRLSKDPLNKKNWFLTATAYSKQADQAQLVGYDATTTGDDGLKHWQRRSIIMPANQGKWNVHWTKSGAMVTDDDGVPLKIKNHFWMFYMGDAREGHDQMGLAKSKDGLTWEDATDKPILAHRVGLFDSKVVEPGPHTILTKDGILLIYNGADDTLAYRTGWALFDRHDPTRLLARADQPIFAPETDWEKHNASKDVHQAPNVVFVEGIVKDKKGGFRVYYGCADSYVGVAHTSLVSTKKSAADSQAATK